MPTTTPENASDLYKSQITNIAVPSPANKAAAVLLTPINGKQIFVNGSDGGWFTGVTGLTPGTLADDGGAYCGTVFIPTGGDGSAGWERENPLPLRSSWFGDNDDAATLQAVGDVSSAKGGVVVILDGDNYQITSTSVDYTGWRGVTFEGAGSAGGWAAADAGGGGPLNTGKATEIETTTAIAAFYGTQGASVTDRTRRLIFKNINFTGVNSALGSGNYGVHWHQDDVAIFSGIIKFVDCMFNGFENGARVTTISGTQATGWWTFENCSFQSCYWDIYAPGGINVCNIIGGGLYYQNNNTAATVNILTDAYGGGIYGKGSSWNISGAIDLSSNSVGIYLDSVNGFTVDGSPFFEDINTAPVIINNCRNGTIGAILYIGTKHIVIANSQDVTVARQIGVTVRVNGQNRDLELSNNNVVYDNSAAPTEDNQNISIDSTPRRKLLPQVVSNRAIRTIIAETVTGTATIDNASTTIKDPFGGDTVTKVTTTGSNQYARNYLVNGAWASGQYVNGLVYMYVPAAFASTIVVSLIGSGGTEVEATIGLYPTDKWFAIDSRALITGTSTSTDFRVTIGATGQVLYLYKPCNFIADADIEPFIIYKKFSDAVDAALINPVMMPGNTIYFGEKKLVFDYTGTPEANLIGRIGDAVFRGDGGTGTVLYVKETGAGTTTGWVAK